jgi:hypothetical protein
MMYSYNAKTNKCKKYGYLYLTEYTSNFLLQVLFT